MLLELLSSLITSLPSLDEAQAKAAELAAATEDPPTDPPTDPPADPPPEETTTGPTPEEVAAAEAAAGEAAELSGGEAAEADPETMEAQQWYESITAEHLGEEQPQQEGEADVEYRVRMLERRAERAEFLAGVMQAEQKVEKRYPGIAEGVKQAFVDALLKNNIEGLFAMLDRAGKVTEGDGAGAESLGKDLPIEGESSSSAGEASGGSVTELPTLESAFEGIKQRMMGNA